MTGPRVLVSGVVLNQPMGGVRRHNAELLPRAAALLRLVGGELSVMEGSEPVGFPLPTSVRRVRTWVPAHPRLARALSEGIRIRHLLGHSSDRFDVVHFGHLPVPRRLPIPFTLTLHDLRFIEPDETSGIGRLLASRLCRSALERAALVITVSETVATTLVQSFDVAPEKIRIVPNAADHLTVHPRRVKEDAPILHVGHLEPHKNVELLIRAIATDPELPPVCLAGAPKGGEDERLKKLANDLGVAQRVTFLGRVEETELPELYSTASCVALPSKLEGFGIVAVEAQRAGVPLCVSDVEALHEVAGSHVPQFDSEDPQDCARAIREAMSVSAAQLESNRERAKRYSWDRSAEALFEVWTEAAIRPTGQSI